jgi:pantoate--beta-alanine ligase
MRVAATRAELAAALAPFRTAGETVGFVPTMGALHAGHLSLLELARERAGRVVASIFVNPTQFGPHEDFARYPRHPEADAALLEAAGCDLLFLPAVETIYPPGSSTRVRVEGPSRGLEGVSRPGHFEGVATDVAILFGLVRPDFAVFGEKDAQQLAVVRALARDLALGVEIVAGETVREADGLALSSRNVFLDPDERRRATVLHRALGRARLAIEGGERSGDEIRRLLAETIAAEPGVELDYVDVVDAASFVPIEYLAGEIVLPVAARVGTTRLLDNFRLRVPTPVEAESTPTRDHVATAGAVRRGET